MTESFYILPILLFSVVIHEISHGVMALWLGDPTAKDMGRLTLNPIPHIDLVGSIIVPLASLLMAGSVFIAWAKPVPVNPANFLNYRRDDILVSVVGPLSNIILSFLCTVILITIIKLEPFLSQDNQVAGQAIDFLERMFAGGITLNVVLAVFNMLPIPPLDGSHVVASLLPAEASKRYRSIGLFGIFIIFMLMRWQPFSSAFTSLIETLTSPFGRIISFFV